MTDGATDGDGSDMSPTIVDPLDQLALGRLERPPPRARAPQPLSFSFSLSLSLSLSFPPPFHIHPRESRTNESTLVNNF